jgi:hypothetical protein
MEFKPRSKINHSPIENPCKFQVVLSEKNLSALRKAAFDNDTTVSEIVRVLISEYLKSLDDDFKER